MSEQGIWNPITTAALREVRTSVAALLLELPEAVWRGHTGIVETAIAQVVEDQYAMRDERDRLRAALTETEDVLLSAKGWLPWRAEDCEWPENRANAERVLSVIERIEAARAALEGDEEDEE